MIENIDQYIKVFNETTIQRFLELYNLLLESTEVGVTEVLWARLPSYYLNGRFVRLIPFNDHINIEAKAVLTYKDKLEGYKITPKGMLQIRHEQSIPSEILKIIFRDSLE